MIFKRDKGFVKLNLSLWMIAITAVLYFVMKSYVFFDEANITDLAYSVLLIAAFYLADLLFNLEFESEHYMAIGIMAIASCILSPLYYITNFHYDKILHFFQPILLSYLILYAMQKLDLKMIWKILFTFFIVTSLTGLWEILEFGVDKLLGMHTQGVFLRIQSSAKLSIVLDGLDDTLYDMIANYAGAFVYLVYSLLRFGDRLEKRA